jgi:hypothetical protein
MLQQHIKAVRDDFIWRLGVLLKAEREARKKEVDEERKAQKQEVDAERVAREKLARCFFFM